MNIFNRLVGHRVQVEGPSAGGSRPATRSIRQSGRVDEGSQRDHRGPAPARDDDPAPTTAPINVFVHLARDKDVEAWQRARRAGTLVGVNDDTPYGYGRAERMGCRVVFSRSGREGPLARLLRLGIRALAGFDYVHARRQGKALAEADVVWTHTESQYLAVAALLGSRARRPKLLGQSVWLFDRWPRLGPLHRLLYRRLIARADLLTVHSNENLSIARALFPRKRVVLVPYGIASETVATPVARPASPLRIVAPGSDRHRDWRTLVEAVKGCEGASLLILSGTASPRLARDAPGVEIRRAATNAEFRAHLDGATLVCVPLKPNHHASGITVVQEAVLAGVPVVATNTGGLAGYFGADEIRYVPPGEVAALRTALLETAADPAASRAMAARAQARMTDGTLGAEAFVRRHVDLSREMLA